MTTHRLLAIEGTLYFPKGGATEDGLFDCEAEPSLLRRYYPAGDVDTCPWPMTPTPWSTVEDLIDRLQRALYDERESNPFFKYEDTIELPDGTPFEF